MRSPSERRAEERRYRADVSYDVYRAGYDPDRIDSDRVGSRFLDGYDAASTARNEIRIQRERRERREEEE